MSTRAAALSGLVIGGLLLVVAWLFELPADRVVVLAPVIVVAAGAAAGIVVLWTRVGWESLSRQRHPWRLVGLGVAVLAVLVVLSLVGLKLPRE